MQPQAIAVQAFATFQKIGMPFSIPVIDLA
jgi:hypothetical protein